MNPLFPEKRAEILDLLVKDTSMRAAACIAALSTPSLSCS
jgi:hypothetical protein